MSKKVGLALAGIHIFIFSCFVLYLEFKADGQLRLLWTLWLPIDFPVSLLVPMIFDVVPKDVEGFSMFRHYAPHFVHGILGPVWWYCLSRFVGSILTRFGSVGRQDK